MYTSISLWEKRDRIPKCKSRVDKFVTVENSCLLKHTYIYFRNINTVK